MGAGIAVDVVVEDPQVGHPGVGLSRPNVHSVVMVVVRGIVPDRPRHGDVVVMDLEVVDDRVFPAASRTDPPIDIADRVVIELDVAASGGN